MTAPAFSPSSATAAAVAAPVRRELRVAFALLLAALFLAANRSAYQGYFSDDDLVNIGWPTFVGSEVFYKWLLTPQFSEHNFRPAGFLYYRIMGRTFELRYPPYVGAIQALHLMNVLLLFLLLRSLGFVQSAAGAVFYAFHAATFEAYWKPMYVFDVLCCCFWLATLLLYLRGRWVAALIPFWLAYKSKEISVMLPVVLLAFESCVGQRRWKRLIPYFAVSLNFGLQALIHNRHVSAQSTYLLRFTPDALWQCAAFYASAIFFLPWAGFALAALPFLVRDRRLYAGLVLTLSAFVPLLALPTRLASAYWYVPMVGVAIALSAVASQAPRWAVAVFFVVWLPCNYAMVCGESRELLARAGDSRSFVIGLRGFARGAPPLKAVIYESVPPHMDSWGAEGAIQKIFGWNCKAVWGGSPKAAEARAALPMAVVRYDAERRTVTGVLHLRE